MPTPSERPASSAVSAGSGGVTSLSLLERVKVRDPEAWQRLVRLYGPLVYQWCRRWQLAPEDAADISQDVFQAVSLHVAGFRRDSAAHSFRAWLWTITRNKMRDHFRRRQHEADAVGGTSAQLRLQEVPEEVPDDGEEASAAGQLVHRALDLIHAEFEERTWQMFWRSAVKGEAPADIAADLGVSADAVRMAKSRVLRRLRQELSE